MNVIMKFGGTSVADAEAMNRVIAIVHDQLTANPQDKPPVVVVSAMSKVTDLLLDSLRKAEAGDEAVIDLADVLAVGAAQHVVLDRARDVLA